MEVADDQNKIGLFVQFDKPRSVLVINSESVKPFVHAFEWFKIVILDSSALIAQIKPNAA